MHGAIGCAGTQGRWGGSAPDWWLDASGPWSSEQPQNQPQYKSHTRVQLLLDLLKAVGVAQHRVLEVDQAAAGGCESRRVGSI